MIRVAAIVLLMSSTLGAGDASPTYYFGRDAKQYMKSFTEAVGPTAEHLCSYVTDCYPPLFAFAGEPSLVPMPPARGRAFRYAQAGSLMNPSCYIFRFSFDGTSTRASVCTARISKVYSDLRRGTRLLDSGEHKALLSLLARWDTYAPPGVGGPELGDVLPALFEFTDGTRHVVVPRYVDERADDAFVGLDVFCYKLLRTIELQPAAPHEPPPRASVSDAVKARTVDSPPESGSSGGR